VIEHAEDGSNIVFHDSEKSKRNMLTALPEVLRYYSSKGYRFEKL
jgi:hypothetical protein